MGVMSKARLPLADKCQYLTITFRRYLAIISKTFAIRFTLKYLRCGHSSYFDIMSDSEEGDTLLLQKPFMFKMKKKNVRKRKYRALQFFNKQEEKETFNNLTRNETSRYGASFR